MSAIRPAGGPAAGPAAAAAPGALDSRVLAIVGSGGDGVALLGDLVLRMAARLGLYGVLVQSYEPQIRGGESAVVLRLAAEEIQYEGDRADLLLCFRLADLARFQGTVRLHAGSVLMLDAAEAGDLPEWTAAVERPPFRHPFTRFESGVEVEGEPKNMLGFALLCRALGWPTEIARALLTERFGRRPQVLARNLGAFDAAWAAEDVPTLAPLPAASGELVTESGNEAVARGAIEAGMRFFAGYPITPSSEILETLIDELPAAGGWVVQAEDEIAALGMVIGASFGGVPAMTATSGPGLSLMTEMLGLSSMAEIPAVVVDCQRAGPATGIPSRTEQSDLFHAVYAGHGDFPRVVLGVFDTVHAREMMPRAFHLAEKYQLPVVVLSDAYIAQRRQIRPAPEPRRHESPRLLWEPGHGAARFALLDATGVSPFRVPGTPGGTYLAAGVEHTAEGSPTADTGQHQQMNVKRFRKLDAVAHETRDWHRTLGAPEARRGVVAWGSQYGVLREWVAAHPEFRVFLPEILHPFPLEALERWRSDLEWMAVLELSFQGQFFRHLASLTDLQCVRSVARSGGVPFTLTELDRLLTEVP